MVLSSFSECRAQLHHPPTIRMTPSLHLCIALLLLLFITFTSPSSSVSPASPAHSVPPLSTLSFHPTSSSPPSVSRPSSSSHSAHSTFDDDPITDLLSDLFDDDDDDDSDDDEQLTTFYLAHVQCRRCLRDNSLFDQPCTQSVASAWGDDDDSDDRSCCGAQCSLPEYQPLQAMQWCGTVMGSDWQGQCVDGLASCPTLSNASIPSPAPLTSPSSCAADLPASKLTCVLCTLDAYQWVTSQSAVSTGDNYAGQCVASASSSTLQSDSVVVGEMDGCPSFVKAANNPQGRWRVLSFLLLFFFVTTSLCTCWGVRRCWQWRLAGKLGKWGMTGVGETPFYALTEASEGSEEPGEGQVGAGPELLLSDGEAAGAQQLSVQSVVYDGRR